MSDKERGERERWCFVLCLCRFWMKDHVKKNWKLMLFAVWN